MTLLRLSLIPLAIALYATPALAGHGNKAARNDRAIILQNNSMQSAHDTGGIILQNHNRNKAIKNRGGIILQNNGMQSANYNGGIILQNHNRIKGAKNRGGIILQNSPSNAEQLPPVFSNQKGATSAASNGSIILQRKNRGGIILQNQAKGAAGGQ